MSVFLLLLLLVVVVGGGGDDDGGGGVFFFFFFLLLPLPLLLLHQGTRECPLVFSECQVGKVVESVSRAAVLSGPRSSVFSVGL